VKMPVPMMLEITIAHAVTKPMVRLGGANLTAAGWVSVVIRRGFYSTFLLHNAEHPRFTLKIEGDESIPVSVSLCFARPLSLVVGSASGYQFAGA
jgi:hypothetical protein